MKRNRLSMVLASVLAFASGCESDPSDEGAAPQDRMTEMLQAGLDGLHERGVSGVLAEVNDGGRRALARSGVARLDDDQPVAFDSYFRMGSNTKTFVAVVALQLVGEGALSLEDTVDRWLPGVVSGNGNDGKLITVRQLLQHTSGLYNFTGDVPALFSADAYLEHRFESAEPEDLVAIALKHPPAFAPGARWAYSNTNYALAGMIIKRVTGNDWQSEVRSRIVEPLGLGATFDPGDEPGLPSPHARAYEQFASGQPLVDVTDMNYTWADAAGSLVTTTADLTKFWGALQRGALLGPAQMAELHATVPAPDLEVLTPGIGYGLGIMRIPTTCGGAYWSHSGDTLGYATRNAVSEDGSRALVISLSTQRADAVLPTLQQTFQLIDQIMCAD